MISFLRMPPLGMRVGACLLCVAIAAGCGEGANGPPRLSLSGKVTYGGAPVPFGDIVFAPDEKSGNNGPAGTAVIENGRYRTESGQGPVAGAQIAIVTGYKSKESTGPEGWPLLFSEARVAVTADKNKTTVDIDVPKKTTT